MSKIINPYRFGNTLKEGLVSYYEFEETGANVAYDAHGDNNGAISGCTLQQASVANLDKCYGFDGANDGVLISSLSNSAFISIGHDGIANDKLSVFIIGGSQGWIASSVSMTTSVWQHVVVTYDGSTVKAYIDNSEVVSSSETGGSAFSWSMWVNPDVLGTNKCMIAADGGVTRVGIRSSDIWDFDGKIDQPALWDRALSGSEVVTLYNSGNGLAYPNFTPNLKDSLVSIWNFDEQANATTCYDSHGSNDGTITGATINQAGKVGKCYGYDGNDYISLPSSILSGEERGAISAWVNTSATLSGGVVDFRNDLTSGFMYYCDLHLSATGQVGFRWADASGENRFYSSTGFNDGGWHHVVVGSNGTNYFLYVDGEEISISMDSGTDNGNWVGDFTAAINYVSVGRRKNNFFNGKIDELAIHDRALTQQEIIKLFNNDKGFAYKYW